MTKIKSFKKGDIILEAGKISPVIYIINNGLIASFIRNEDGSDFIRTFYKKYDEVASLKSLISNQNSTACYKCLIDSDVYELNFMDFMEQSSINNEFDIFLFKIF